MVGVGPPAALCSRNWAFRTTCLLPITMCMHQSSLSTCSKIQV